MKLIKKAFFHILKCSRDKTREEKKKFHLMNLKSTKKLNTKETFRKNIINNLVY